MNPINRLQIVTGRVGAFMEKQRAALQTLSCEPLLNSKNGTTSLWC